jgi:hypothetical protein
MPRKIIGILGALFFVSAIAFSQNPDKPAKIFPPEGSYAESLNDSSKTQNPTVALFKSMLIPGLGQIGNKKYIKAGAIIGLESYLIANLIHYSKITSDAKKEYDAADDPSLVRLYNKYRDAKDSRNLHSWLLGATIFISMFDAYVDAHLARFPKYEKSLSLDINPNKDNHFYAGLILRF